MLFLYLFAIFVAAAIFGADLPSGVRGEDTAARGDVRAMHLAAWHQAASGWYGASPSNKATAGAIPQASFGSRLPGGATGSAVTFTATGLHTAADGAGTVVSWALTSDPEERGQVGRHVARHAGLSMSAGTFEAASATIVNPNVAVAARVAVPPALAALIPDGAPVIATKFE